MAPGRCRLLAALAIAAAPGRCGRAGDSTGAQPGREREQLAPPQAPARPAGRRQHLPPLHGRPARRREHHAHRQPGRHHRRDRLQRADFAPLYADLIGGEVPLAAVYDLARRITAKYGAAGYVLSRAVVPPQNFGRHGAVVRIQVVEGYVDNVVWPEKLTRYRDFFTDYAARIVADRPANIRTLERYLLLANDLPGLKFATTLKPSPTHPNASTLIVEVTEKPHRRDRAHRQSRHERARALAVSRLGDGEQYRRARARGVHRHLCGHVPARGAAIPRCRLPAGAQQRGADRLRQRELRLRPARHASCCARSTTARAARSLEAGLTYPVIRSRETNLILTGARLHDQRRQLQRRRACSRATGCAASASRPTPTGPTASSASTRST